MHVTAGHPRRTLPRTNREPHTHTLHFRREHGVQTPSTRRGVKLRGTGLPVHGEHSSVGRAPGCGPGGRGFKPRCPPQMGEVGAFGGAPVLGSPPDLPFLTAVAGAIGGGRAPAVNSGAACGTPVQRSGRGGCVSGGHGTRRTRGARVRCASGLLSKASMCGRGADAGVPIDRWACPRAHTACSGAIGPAIVKSASNTSICIQVHLLSDCVTRILGKLSLLWKVFGRC